MEGPDPHPPASFRLKKKPFGMHRFNSVFVRRLASTCSTVCRPTRVTLDHTSLNHESDFVKKQSVIGNNFKHNLPRRCKFGSMFNNMDKCTMQDQAYEQRIEWLHRRNK